MAKMIPETEFIRRESPFPRYLPYPVFLLDTDLTMTARVVYALLLNRVSLSQMNGWVDEFGRVFVIYTIESLVHDIHKGRTTVKKALAELEEAGLLVRRRKDFGRPSRLYVKTIPQQDSPCAEKPFTENQATVKKLTVTSPKDGPYDSQETVSVTGNYRTTNNLIQKPEYRDINRFSSLYRDGSEGKIVKRFVMYDED